MTDQPKSLTHLSYIITEQSKRIRELEADKVKMKTTVKDSFIIAAIQGLLCDPKAVYDAEQIGKLSNAIGEAVMRARK